MITLETFKQLVADGYNRIPFHKTILADVETPVSSYLKAARGPYSYLLESVHGGEKWGRYSILGLPSRTVLKVNGQQVVVEHDGKVVESYQDSDPLNFIEAFKSRYKAKELPELPRFYGGLVGYFSYDCVRYVEPRLGEASNDVLQTPDILLMLSDEVLIFDNLSGVLHVIVMADPLQSKNSEVAYQQALARVDSLCQRLQHSVPELPRLNLHAEPCSEQKFQSNTGRERYEAAVDKVKDYILAGDAMQVVLSHRLSMPFDVEPLNLYRSLRSLNPSPYMYFLDLGNHHIVGSSPEILTRFEDGELTVRPIAGTRRRGNTEADDLGLEKELLADPKEIAEHVMLIDLGRNDVGRVAKTGTVELTEKMVVERYSHVMHITSNVVGQLQENLSSLDVLKAALPAGTLSGAPKIRAMEIIDELELEKRGIYGGAIGYLAWNGNMDTAIAIRTALIKDGKIYVQAGAGLVADSVPSLEWEETMNKARAIFRAVDRVI